MKMRTAQQLTAARLKGETFTCSGCRYRVLLGLISSEEDSKEDSKEDSVWTENCLKGRKLPADHSKIGTLSEPSIDFETPCRLFYGSPESEEHCSIKISHTAIPAKTMSLELVGLDEKGTRKMLRRLVPTQKATVVGIVSYDEE
jgi:hypothetical protein